MSTAATARDRAAHGSTAHQPKTAAHFRLEISGCQNPHLFERSAGRAMAVTEIMRVIKDAGDGGVSLLGGEPLDQPEGTAMLCAALRARRIHTIVYTGYVYERLVARSHHEPALRDILDAADVLVDGPYVEALRDENIRFRGSRNQRVIDLARTRGTGSLTLIDWDTLFTIVLRAGAVSLPACAATRPVTARLAEPETEHVCGYVSPHDILQLTYENATD